MRLARGDGRETDAVWHGVVCWALSGGAVACAEGGSSGIGDERQQVLRLGFPHGGAEPLGGRADWEMCGL